MRNTQENMFLLAIDFVWNKSSRPVGVASAAKKYNRGQMPSVCDNLFPLAPFLVWISFDLLPHPFLPCQSNRQVMPYLTPRVLSLAISPSNRSALARNSDEIPQSEVTSLVMPSFVVFLNARFESSRQSTWHDSLYFGYL